MQLHKVSRFQIPFLGLEHSSVQLQIPKSSHSTQSPSCATALRSSLPKTMAGDTAQGATEEGAHLSSQYVGRMLTSLSVCSFWRRDAASRHHRPGPTGSQPQTKNTRSTSDAETTVRDERASKRRMHIHTFSWSVRMEASTAVEQGHFLQGLEINRGRHASCCAASSEGHREHAGVLSPRPCVWPCPCNRFRNVQRSQTVAGVMIAWSLAKNGCSAHPAWGRSGCPAVSSDGIVRDQARLGRLTSPDGGDLRRF